MSESVSGIKHPAFREAERLTRPVGRRETGRYLVEDLSLVVQALATPLATVEAVFCLPTEVATLAPLCTSRRVPLYVLGNGLLQKLVGTGYETAVTAAAIVVQNRVAPESLLTPEALILCGERIQDPRNIGVLIRTADALGCAGLLLSADSAEPFRRDSMRSTTGSILRLPIALTENLPETLTALRALGTRVVASSGQAKALASQETLSIRPLVLIVGNEQNGITDATAAASDAVVKLPMHPETGADSLNVTVAAGMLLYEALRWYSR